jgi:hypothetical protein
LAFLKRRPTIKLRVPREIRAGQTFEGEIILDARRPVPIESVTVELLGSEWAQISGGEVSIGRTVIFVRLGGVLSGATELQAGPTRYRCVFELPRDAPPSYHGVNASTEYRVKVHAAIPWWPDAEGSFEVLVGPGTVADERPGRPQVFSSAPSGPDAQEPYVEGSLSASVMAPGDTISGAVALGNVRWSRYKVVKVALIGWQTVLIGRRRDEREVSRYQLAIPIDKAEEQKPIRFDLRVPDDGLPPTWQSTLWQMRWFFEVKAELRWGSDLILRVPVMIVPRQGARESAVPVATAYAPPSVGSERIQAMWRDVGRELGLSFENETLRGRAGGATPTEYEIRREHRGKQGIFLVAELSYPSLGMDLEIRRGTGWFALQRIPLGDFTFDRKHVVRARDPAQVAAFAASVLPSMKQLDVVSLDDERARIETRDSGQNPKRLRGFVERVSWMARSLVAARLHLPPPAPFVPFLHEWQDVAERLKGQLHPGGMAIHGEIDGLPAEIRIEWSGGEPEAATLQVRSEASLGDHLVDLVAGQDGEIALDDALPVSGDARPLLRSLARGARRLRVERQQVTLSLPGPRFDAIALYERLEAMRKLCLLLRPAVGPYR